MEFIDFLKYAKELSEEAGSNPKSIKQLMDFAHSMEEVFPKFFRLISYDTIMPIVREITFSVYNNGTSCMFLTSKGRITYSFQGRNPKNIALGDIGKGGDFDDVMKIFC